jgi:porphobilinogen deaminase
LANRISHVLDIKQYGYAVGQGALAIVCRENDRVTQRIVACMEDLATRWACEAERGVLRTLNGGCKVPIAIRTTMDMPSKRYLEEHPAQAKEAEAASAASAAAAAPAPSSSGNDMARTVHVWCSVMSLDGTVEVHATHAGTCDARAGVSTHAEALVAARRIGEELGAVLMKKGADKLLEGIVEPSGALHAAPQKRAPTAAQ